MITLDASSSAQASSASTVSATHVVGTLTNGVLFAIITVQDSNNANFPVISCKYGGVAMTQVRSDMALSPDNVGSAIYQLVAPSAGSASITVQVTGDLGNVAVSGVSLAGVDQTTPVDTSSGVAQTNTSPTVTLTTQSDNAWILSGCCAESTFSATGSGQTVIATLTDQSFENSRFTYSGPFTPTGSQTQSFTLSGAQPWCMSSVSVKPAFVASALTQTWSGVSPLQTAWSTPSKVSTLWTPVASVSSSWTNPVYEGTLLDETGDTLITEDDYEILYTYI